MNCIPNVFEIFTFDEKTLYLKAVNVGCNSGPLDLSECTEIIIRLPLADGSFQSLALSSDQVAIITPAVLGKFSALIVEEVSGLLNPGLLQNFDVIFTIGAETFTVAYQGALSVFERAVVER